LVSGVTIQPPIDADVDDRGCKQVAEGICGIIGGMLGGSIGAIAVGIACGVEVDKYKGEMNSKIRDMGNDALGKLKLDLTN
jgi:hypothetical protein